MPGGVKTGASLSEFWSVLRPFGGDQGRNSSRQHVQPGPGTRNGPSVSVTRRADTTLAKEATIRPPQNRAMLSAGGPRLFGRGSRPKQRAATVGQAEEVFANSTPQASARDTLRSRWGIVPDDSGSDFASRDSNRLVTDKEAAHTSTYISHIREASEPWRGKVDRYNQESRQPIGDFLDQSFEARALMRSYAQTSMEGLAQQTSGQRRPPPVSRPIKVSGVGSGSRQSTRSRVSDARTRIGKEETRRHEPDVHADETDSTHHRRHERNSTGDSRRQNSTLSPMSPARNSDLDSAFIRFFKHEVLTPTSVSTVPSRTTSPTFSVVTPRGSVANFLGGVGEHTPTESLSPVKGPDLKNPSRRPSVRDPQGARSSGIEKGMSAIPKQGPTMRLPVMRNLSLASSTFSVDTEGPMPSFRQHNGSIDSVQDFILPHASCANRRTPTEDLRRGQRPSASQVKVAPIKVILDRMPDLSLSNFQLLATVGTGTFGRVRLATLKNEDDSTPVALKILKKSEVIRLNQVEHVKSEKDILKRIHHPFVVNLFATFQDSKRLFMVMEFVHGGELFSYLRKEGKLNNDGGRFYASEITLALQYLHHMDIIYRDLKPENLLIDGGGHIKVTDFGFAKVVKDRTWTVCGTPEYLAPEIIQSKGHGKSVDWWALGILIFEMLAGYPPFYDDNPFGIYQKILTGKLVFPRYIDMRAKDLIKRLLSHDRAKRFGCLKAGAEDIKRHKWFKSIDWDACLNREINPPFIPKTKSMLDTSMFDQYPESTEGSASPISPEEQELFVDF